MCSMNLENIVTSLELSQKLEQVGINQDSLFYWLADYIDFPPIVVASGYPHKDWGDTEYICAFTAQELWEMFHFKNKSIQCLYDEKNLHRLKLEVGALHIPWHYAMDVNHAPNIAENNLANCLAQLIIAQHEEKSE